MRNAIEGLAGTTARGVGWLASGIGPHPVFAPDNGSGSDDGGEGAAGGDGAGGSGAANVEDGDADEGTPAGSADDAGGRQPVKGGLLDRRKRAGDAGDADNDAGDAPDDGRPEGLPDKFWDADKKAIRADALAKSYAELEARHGKLKRDKGGDVPEKPEDYFADGIELPETVDRLTIDGADDPGLKAAASVFHKYGVGRETAINIVRDMFVEMNETAPAPIDTDAEFAALGTPEQAEATIEAVGLWLDGAASDGRMSERDVEIATNLAETADGVRFLVAMRALAGEQRVPSLPGSGPRGMSREQWGEAYKAAVREGDYKEQERLDGMSAAIFGDDPSHGANAVAVDASRSHRTKR